MHIIARSKKLPGLLRALSTALLILIRSWWKLAIISWRWRFRASTDIAICKHAHIPTMITNKLPLIRLPKIIGIKEVRMINTNAVIGISSMGTEFSSNATINPWIIARKGLELYQIWGVRDGACMGPLLATALGSKLGSKATFWLLVSVILLMLTPNSLPANRSYWYNLNIHGENH